jgi:hypothetical protein
VPPLPGKPALTPVPTPPIPSASRPAVAPVDAHRCQCQAHAATATHNGAASPCPCSVSSSSRSSAPSTNGQVKPNGFPVFPDGRPDFSRMSAVDRLAYHRERLGLGR